MNHTDYYPFLTNIKHNQIMYLHIATYSMEVSHKGHYCNNMYLSSWYSHREPLDSLHFTVEVLVDLSELAQLQHVRVSCSSVNTAALSSHVFILIPGSFERHRLSAAEEAPFGERRFSTYLAGYSIAAYSLLPALDRMTK